MRAEEVAGGAVLKCPISNPVLDGTTTGVYADKK